jgi:hypothetical protein
VGRTFLVILALSGLATGCRHGELRAGAFTKSDVRYRIGELPPGWKQTSLRDNDLAWIANDSGHTIALNSTCDEYRDAPLPALTQHLLMGFTERQLIKQETVPLDGREALRSHYQAKLDGVPIELLLVVMKKNGCIYDFTYLSPVGRFVEKLADFEQFLQGFKTEAP